MTGFFLTVLCLYVLLVAALGIFQRKLLYFPNTAIAAPEQYGLGGFSEMRAVTADGVSVQMWYRPAAPGFPTLVYFHGNAGNLGDRAGMYDALARPGFGMLAVSYRGYGASGGTPTEQGLYADARAALDSLARTLDVPPQRTLLFGESLGTGVAVQMATEYDVGGLILEAPYTAVAARAAEIYFYIPVRLLIRDHYDSLKKIGRVRAPLLLLHGELDQTIPAAHGRRLLAAATSPKRGVFFPDVGHNDFDTEVISSHVLEFAREHRLITQ